MNINFERRHAARVLAAALAAAGIGAPAFAQATSDDDDRGGMRSGKVFISSNGPAGNEVLVYQRGATGASTLLARVPTQGLGTGAGLGSQGAVTLSRNGHWLFVVNAASNSVSTFALGPQGLELKSVVDSGGLTPTSVTEHAGRVFVLNSGASGNVTGFRNHGGTLVPVEGAVGSLSTTTGTAPAQVGFSDDGDLLAVTERATSKITSFLVQPDGTLGHKTVIASSGAVPFGFAFNRRDVLIVSEANASAVSSYRFAQRSAAPVVVTPSLPNGQGAACWIAVTPDGRFAFSANASTSSVSAYAVAHDGQLSLSASAAAVTGVSAGALDMAVTPSGSQLHVFANRGLRIVSYAITPTGALMPLGSAGGMPAGSAGLAVN